MSCSVTGAEGGTGVAPYRREGWRRPSSACRHLLPVERGEGGSFSAGDWQTVDDSVLLPVLRGEMFGRTMRGGAAPRKLFPASRDQPEIRQFPQTQFRSSRRI